MSSHLLSKAVFVNVFGVICFKVSWTFFIQSLLDTTSYFTPWLVPGSSWSIGDITAISYLSPSWIYLTQSSGLLLKWFSAFRPCVPCVRLCAKGLNPLPLGLDTGWGNEEEWSYWFRFGGQGGSSRGRIGIWEQMLPFVIHIVSNKQETPTIIHAAESEILLKTADKKEQEDNRWMVRLYIYTYIYSPDTDIQFCWKQSEDTRSSLTIISGLPKWAGCLVCSVILW